MKGPRLTLEIVDSHTAGEPTRVVIAGAPDLGAGTAAERLMVLRQRHDWLRRAVILEPRGSDLLVGALVLPPCDPACRLAAIFFNNAGYLGMCGHGTIGLVTTLAEGGALSAGEHRIETPVGVVTTRLHEDGAVSVTNVRSYRLAARVPVEVEGVGTVVGDVAWGGNWFFLTDAPDQELSITNVPALTDLAGRIRRALTAHGITGANGAEIDHVELFGPPHTAGGDSRSFVLCPGGAYDRSPCGTGTSAKLACLYADGKLRPGQVWRQESVIGSFFEAQFEADGDGVLPTITGRAYVTGSGTLILDPNDPYRFGIPSPGPSGRGDL